MERKEKRLKNLSNALQIEAVLNAMCRKCIFSRPDRSVTKECKACDAFKTLNNIGQDMGAGPYKKPSEWTEEADAELLRLYENNVVRVCAEQLEITAGAANSRLDVLRKRNGGPLKRVKK